MHALVLLLLALLLPVACSQERIVRAGTADDPWLLGMSQSNLGEPWRVQMNRDLQDAAAKHPEITIEFKDAQYDASLQRSQVEELLDRGVDVLLISPKETGPLDEVVGRAYDRGVPVIVLDRELGTDRYTTFIGGDNEAIGRAAGEWVRDALDGKGTIVELQGLMTTSPAQDRHQGFLDGLDAAHHPGLEIAWSADMGWLEDRARTEMESALGRLPHIDLVYAHNDPGAHGAWLAARAAGREQEMRFVGIDALPHEGVEYVRQGILAATFRYPTGGKEAIDTALRVLHGETVPKRITLKTEIFTSDNVEAGGEPVK